MTRTQDDYENMIIYGTPLPKQNIKELEKPVIQEPLFNRSTNHTDSDWCACKDCCCKNDMCTHRDSDDD